MSSIVGTADRSATPLSVEEPSKHDHAGPRFSVIVPMHRDTEEFRWCVRQCLGLRCTEFELIVVSDNPVTLPSGVISVVTGSAGITGPGVKRDLGMRRARGEFLAFIDDDAAPRFDWLERALLVFAIDPTIGAVVGPGVTPAESSFRERVGGAFYESLLGSGPYRYRFRPEPRRDVDDYPAYNFVVRRRAAAEVRGWRTNFYGGEDTVICLALVGAGWRIVYDPTVVVFHKRRPIVFRHLAQIGNVGRHRGYFVKAYPRTSLRLSYFVPTAGSLALAGLLAASSVSVLPRVILIGLVGTYLFAIGATSLREGNSFLISLSLPAISLASHLVYGIEFLRGLLQPRLSR